MTPLQDRQIEFCSYFQAAGYPPKSAAAIGGNATRENLCLPTTAGAKDHGSDGVLQWRQGRLIELQAMTDWQSLKTQAAFTILELQRDYKALEADLRAGTKTLATLTLDFCDVFERPSADGRVADRRIGAASDCMNLITPVAMPKEIIMPTMPPMVATAPPISSLTKGTIPMPPFDPILAAQLVSVFAPLVETLISGLIKEIVSHAGQGSASGTGLGGLPKLPIPIGQLPIDPAVIEKLVMDVLAKQMKPA